MSTAMRASWLSDYDLYLLGEGTHTRAYDKMGAHLGELDGRRGVHFAVWAPNARQVSAIGDFDEWNSRSNVLESAGSSGMWEDFVPDVAQGETYKYHTKSNYGSYEVDKADPYAFAAVVRPQTASRVWDLSAYSCGDSEWMANRAERNGQLRGLCL
jgi:1,4-alpha-glucan branching enzyme